MIRKQIFVFLLRWLVCSGGMYLCITWFGHVDSTAAFSAPWVLYVVAGLIFSVVNSVVKPLVKMLALPLAIVTMGISTILINVGMVLLTIYLLPGVSMDVWGALFSSIILGGINTLMTLLIS